MLQVKNKHAKERAMELMSDILDNADYIALIAKASIYTGQIRRDIKDAMTERASGIITMLDKLEAIIDKYAE